MAESLSTLTLTDFLERLASPAPTPGGGSASALAGATGAALLVMVLELTAGRADLDRDVESTRAALERLRDELTGLVSLDAAAYDAVVAARRLPRDDDAAAEQRRTRIAEATRGATRVPLRMAAAAGEVLAIAEDVASFGRRSAISDVGVAAELAAAAVRGAVLNVTINLPALPEGDPLRAEAAELEELLADVEHRLASVREDVAKGMA